MAKPNLNVDVRSINATTSLLELKGELYGFAESTLMDAFAAVTDQGARTIILDFNDVSFMSSSGIGLLITMLIRANRQGQRIFAIGLNEHYRNIFTLIRLDQSIPVFATEEEALRELVSS